MKNVGVIGAGTMGQGIANAFATAGYNVTVCDIKIEWAQNGINKIGAKLDKLVSREKITAEKAEVVQQKADTAKVFTEQKIEQAKQNITSSRNGENIPIEQGELSKSSTTAN